MQDYKKGLNQKQLEAVETIDGPVLVLAGAGTGKTQTIATRIANILAKTDTEPQNILCLSFTENAANNMRERLIKYIGPDAYKVRIHTFHSFCNEVIMSNFNQRIESLDDLERIETIQKLIDELSPTSPLKPWGDIYFYQKSIESNIQSLKRENVTPEKLLELINLEIEFLKKTKDLFLKLKTTPKETIEIFEQIQKFASGELQTFLNYQKILFDQGFFETGKAKNPLINFKNTLLKFYLDLEKNAPKQLEFQKIYSKYQENLTKISRYDYEDMILFALNEFKKNPDLLFDYQEKYQYILVDEYQDANSSQNELLTLLTNYYDNPNLFVVGDDDQSIFRFQGANLENIYDFVKRYKPKVITLNNNYRSHQTILDSSSCVINNNKNRISSIIDNIDKNLISAKNDNPHPISIFSATNPLEENYFVAKKINELIKAKVDPKEIAVIYRNNADVSDLLPLLEKYNIRYNLSSGNNILKDLKIQQLITLLKYIENPNEELLFPVLAFDFLKIKSIDLYKFFKEKKTCKKIEKFEKRVAFIRKYKENHNLNKTFNKIIRKFGILKQIIKNKDYETLLKFNTFYDELKKQDNLSDFLHRLDLYIENDVSVNVEDMVLDNQSINLLTVHKAKGLEYEHVFIINLVDSRWGENRNRNILKLPYGILKYEINKNLDDISEDDRRLFYVALTRAKKDLYLSYSTTKPTQFIAEIKEDLICHQKPDIDFSKEALLFNFQKDQSLINDLQFETYLKNHLKENYKLSPTNLNSYLRCPLCFYYKTILRIPEVKNKNASYGTAVHQALSDLFTKKINKKEFLLSFKNNLFKENLAKKIFDDVLSFGEKELSAYFDHYKDSFNFNCLSEFNFKSLNVHLDDVPITGNIDKIDIDGDKGIVVDFKTGNPDNREHDADYTRQILFYKLLADNAPQFKYKIQFGLLDYIRNCKQRKIEIKKEDLENLKVLVKEVYNKILNLEFNKIGEKCKDESHIHQFKKI